MKRQTIDQAIIDGDPTAFSKIAHLYRDWLSLQNGAFLVLYGGYLGEYNGMFELDGKFNNPWIWFSYVDIQKSMIGDLAGLDKTEEEFYKPMRKLLEDMKYSEQLAVTGAPFIESINLVSPVRPDGSPVTIPSVISI